MPRMTRKQMALQNANRNVETARRHLVFACDHLQVAQLDYEAIPRIETARRMLALRRGIYALRRKFLS